MKHPLRSQGWTQIAAFALLAQAVGCGDGRIRTYPTTGTVLVNGKPADGATVIFCPVEGTDEFMRERPWGETDTSGNFALTTFDKDDGAPAGEYKVMIRWPAPARASQPTGDPERQERPGDRLRGRYFHPEKSGLTASVDKGGNEVPPFELVLKR